MQVSLPSFELAAPAYYILALSEASSNLARYDGIRYGLSCQVCHVCSWLCPVACCMLDLAAALSWAVVSMPPHAMSCHRCASEHQQQAICQLHQPRLDCTTHGPQAKIYRPILRSQALCMQEEALQKLYGGTRAKGLNGEVKRRILMGTHALSAGYFDAYYKRAQQVVLPALVFSA